jgi:tRNA threonylcarbamoyladenosine biosynthesis protein TsaE
MGAGKTTFVKALGDFLGIDEVSSPTFAIVNEYHVPGQHADEIGPFIHHIDLYRLEEEEEIVGIGLEEYLNDPYLTIVEWPEISKMLWPEEYVELKLAELEEGKRELLIILHIS